MKEIEDNFNEQAKLLNPYVDFFYFDVLSSIKEFKCGIKAIREFNKPYLIGIHISEGTRFTKWGKNFRNKKYIRSISYWDHAFMCFTRKL